MIKVKFDKPLLIEERTLDIPLSFVEVFALNPANLKKWVVGLKNSKNKFDELKVKDILNTKVNTSIEDNTFLLDVTFGKDTHKLLLKKPTQNTGLDFILTEDDKFKIETNIILTPLGDSQTKIHLETKLLEAKHAFHPITSFEIKYFFRKSLSNFIDECEKNYRTLEAEDKTLETTLFSYYQENLKQARNLIEPLKNDLGPEEYERLQQKLKTLISDSSSQLGQLFASLLTVIPSADIDLINGKILQFIKDHIFILKGITNVSHSEALMNINEVTKLQLENINFLVPKLLKDVDSNKIEEIQMSLTQFLSTTIKDINDIIEEIRSKVPPQHLKNLELGFVNILKTDLDSSKTLLEKFTPNDNSLTEKEKQILSNLKTMVEKYETLINKRDSQAYIATLNMSEASLNKFMESLKAISSNLTAEKIESTKSLISSNTQESYKVMTRILASLTPENLSQNEEIANKKIEDILDRYSKALKIIAPNTPDEKISSIRAEIEKVLKDGYKSFYEKQN